MKSKLVLTLSLLTGITLTFFAVRLPSAEESIEIEGTGGSKLIPISLEGFSSAKPPQCSNLILEVAGFKSSPDQAQFNVAGGNNPNVQDA
jgi:hypothetical protein